MENHDKDSMHWFQEALFGMFIHWGPYAVAGRGEWVMHQEQIPYEKYAKRYVQSFHAERFDPDAWVDLAVEAGMKYIVFTTRHHDGFAMWDTATSNYNAVQMGPRRDIVKRLSDAVRRRGLKLGFYYSMADWRHPDYPRPYDRDWPTAWKDDASERRFADYYRAQLKELMTQYGKVDLLWYDGCLPLNRFGVDVNQMVKQLQPHILINNRHGLPFDFECSEQTIKPAAQGVPWEACMTLNANWGYHADDQDYKTPEQVVSMLLETSSQGGNLLLNVGPQPDGVIPGQSCDILREVGAWLRNNRSSLEDASHRKYTAREDRVTMAEPIYMVEASIVPEQAKRGERVTMTARFDVLAGDLQYVVLHVASYDIWERFVQVSESHYELTYDVPYEAPIGGYKLEICGVGFSGASGPKSVLHFEVVA